MKNYKSYSTLLSALLFSILVVVSGLFDTSGHVITADYESTFQVELAEGTFVSIDKEEKSFFTAHSALEDVNFKKHNSAFIFDNNFLASYKTVVSVKYQSISQKLNSFNPISYFNLLNRNFQKSDEPHIS